MMESNGVSPDLRATYFAMPDDPDWPLSADDAAKYNLVTKVLAKTNF